MFQKKPIFAKEKLSVRVKIESGNMYNLNIRV